MIIVLLPTPVTFRYAMETRIAQLSFSVEEDDAFIMEGSSCSQTV